MPMRNYLYPLDWPEISLREKVRAGWMCEQCGADCWQPVSQQNRLTVHHIDHNPANCDPANLIALCAVCHLRIDALWHARNAKVTRAAKRRGPMLPLGLE